mgnify:CR=1 FL=1
MVSYQIWKKLLKKLEKTKYYDAAKKKYDNLKKQIEAVQKINSQFESDALVDGSYNASIAVKSDANFNNLPESVTTTGNASLDSTIQEAIKGGKTQLEEKAKAASVTSAATAADSANTVSPAAPSGDNTSGAASNGGGSAASNTSGAQNGSANSGSTGATGGTTGGSAAASTVVTRGITNYNPSILQRDRSRVPYNANVVADTSNPAWIWLTVFLIRLSKHHTHVVTSQEITSSLSQLTSSMVMATTTCTFQMELTSSVSTVRQVTMLVMVQVTQINLIINNNLRHSLGSVFCFILVKA